MSDTPKQKQLRFTKIYSVDSLHHQQYEALKAYYGHDLNAIFFSAAWSVLGPLASALMGASQDEVRKQNGPKRHLALALETEALTLAISNGESQSYLANDEPVAHEDFSPLLVSDDFEQDLDFDSGNLPIAGDPFG